MPYYVPNFSSKTTCIGNTLSTFNISFSNLDTNLYNLSTYTVNSVNYLSSTMISVSSALNSRINFLSASVISVSSILANRVDSLSSYTFTNLNPRVENISATLGGILYYLNANVANAYYNPIVFSTTSDNQSVIINFSPLLVGNLNERQNAQIRLNHNVNIADFPYVLNGLNGNISIFIDTAGKTVTGFGPMWIFSGTSALKTTLSARNLIRYYVDSINNSTRILAELLTF